MAGWEIAILVGGAVLGFIVAMYFERHLHDLILRCVADSLWRLLGLLAAVLVAGLVLAVILIQLLPISYQSVPTVTVIGTALFFIGAMVVIMPFFPGIGPALSGAGSSRSELRKAGGSTRVSVVLGWGGSLVSLILFGFAVLAPALVLIDP